MTNLTAISSTTKAEKKKPKFHFPPLLSPFAFHTPTGFPPLPVLFLPSVLSVFGSPFVITCKKGKPEARAALSVLIDEFDIDVVRDDAGLDAFGQQAADAFFASFTVVER